MSVAPLRPPVARLCFLDDPVISGCGRLQVLLIKLMKFTRAAHTVTAYVPSRLSGTTSSTG